ncbi:MAG TPA: hypothetical protein VK308_01205 [Pyrinomonadaceae bacterium]|nr:hypothetical protein [Pyrinomonadaceae bacterium]
MWNISYDLHSPDNQLLNLIAMHRLINHWWRSKPVVWIYWKNGVPGGSLAEQSLQVRIERITLLKILLSLKISAKITRQQ